MHWPILKINMFTTCGNRAFRKWKPVLCGVTLGMLLGGVSVFGADDIVPWECTGYSGEAQTRCMKTLLELQQEKIAQLEAQLKIQEGTMSELKQRMDRQEAVARKEAQTFRPDPRYLPPAYDAWYGVPYAYGAPLFPSVGLYMGTPWRYPGYWGYGPGYWGRPGLNFHFRFGSRHRR